jgi:hypothetical protein
MLIDETCRSKFHLRWLSVVDVCGVLTESLDSGAYWRKLKQRLKKEGSEVVTFCHDLRLEASDETGRLTLTFAPCSTQ